MLGWYHEQGVHGTQGRVCIEHRAGYVWNPGQGIHGTRGRVCRVCMEPWAGNNYGSKCTIGLARRLWIGGNHPGQGTIKYPCQGMHVLYSYPGQGALFIPCSGYVPFLVPWPGCTAHTLLRVPWSGYEYGTYPDLGPGRQNQSYARYPEQGMTSVWPISWSYTGIDWPGYDTGFAVSRQSRRQIEASIDRGQSSRTHATGHAVESPSRLRWQPRIIVRYSRGPQPRRNTKWRRPRYTLIDLLPNYGPGTSKRYREPVTTGNSVISICEKRNFRRSSDLAEPKLYRFSVLVVFDMPSTNHFFWPFPHKSAWQWFWWGFLGCSFLDALSCCIKILTKFPTA